MKIAQFTAPYRYQLILKTYHKWIKPGEKVLDIGCGNGIISQKLMRDLNIQVTGADIQNYLHVKIPFLKIKPDLSNLKPNSFDTVLLNDMLHHIDKNLHQEILKEVLRAANKVLIFDAEPTLIGKIADIVLNSFHYSSLATPLSFRTTAEWVEIFNKLKIKHSSIRLKRPFWYPFSHIAFYLKK